MVELQIFRKNDESCFEGGIHKINVWASTLQEIEDFKASAPRGLSIKGSLIAHHPDGRFLLRTSFSKSYGGRRRLAMMMDHVNSHYASFNHKIKLEPKR